MKVEKDQNIRVVELFAGVGGFRVGFERCSSRFKTIWANQWEPGQSGQWAYKCYCKNFGEEANCCNEDIATVLDQVPDHDLLVGGFPCQDYSVAHTGAQGIEGKKGVLWWSINDIIRAHHPRFILLENVDRLLRSPAKQRGRDFGIILYCLEKEGYLTEWRVINAADYGNAQRRRRTFIFAVRKENVDHSRLEQGKFDDAAFEWITKDGFFASAFPVEAEHDADRKVSVSDVDGHEDLVDVTENFAAAFYNAGVMLDGKVYSEELTPCYIPAVTLSEIVEDGPVDERYYITGEALEKWTYLKGAKKIERTSKTGYSYWFSEGPIAFPDPLDHPGRTMLTSEGSLNRSTHIIEDKSNGKKRKLTPIECERLNGFPDNWTDTEIPERQRYFIMGNALVVPLITKMGEQILKML